MSNFFKYAAILTLVLGGCGGGDSNSGGSVVVPPPALPNVPAKIIMVSSSIPLLQFGVSPVGFDMGNNDALGKYLASRSSAPVFNEAGFLSLLRATSPASIAYQPGQLEAVAHLLAAYSDAIPVQIMDRETAARFRIGIRGYLVERVKRLLLTPTSGVSAAITEAMAVTKDNVLRDTARYQEQLPFDANANYFPAPDFYQMQSGQALAVASDTACLCGVEGPFNLNDSHFEPNGDGRGFYFPGPYPGTITAVEVPTVNQGQINAVLNSDGTVTMTASSNYKGVTYFDYITRHPRGDVARGRVYITIV